MSERILLGGRFGSAAEILRDATSSLVSVGAPAELAASFSVHPMLDNLSWERRTGKVKEATGDERFTTPVSGDPFDARRWFSRAHPLDEALTDAISSAVSLALDEAVVAETPDDEFARLITRADALLGETLPRLWPTLQPFVTRVYDVRSGRSKSATFDNIGGAVVLFSPAHSVEGSERDLVVAVAESLLHEAAHSKSYRLFRSFKRVSVPQSPEFIDIPWWHTARDTWAWDIDRSIVACHVYAHLAVFYEALTQTAGASKRAATCAFRAAYLGNLLLQLDRSWLDDEWREFVIWICSAIPEVSGLNDVGRRALELKLVELPEYSSLAAATNTPR